MPGATLLVEQQRERTAIALLEQYLARPAKARQFDCAAVARGSEELISLAESPTPARAPVTRRPRARGDPICAISQHVSQKLGPRFREDDRF
jgi:hypothetical protein